MQNLDRQKYALAYLGLPNEMLKVAHKDNPFLNRTEFEIDNPDLHLLQIFRNPKYVYTTAKYLLNVKLLPFQVAIIQEIWDKPFPIVIASRGAGKSFMLAVYSLIKAILYPGTKVVITGAGFRQAKFVFEYVEKIWLESGILQSIANDQSGTVKATDRWALKLNGSSITAIPTGTGDKIRGLRANIIINDEFNSANPQVYEEVIQGFGSVSQDPQEKTILEAKRQAMIDDGIWNAELETKFNQVSTHNQSIISGTCGYSFEHFCDYWQKYKGIIKSGGDLDKIAESLGRQPNEDLHWKDYSIIRLPAELIPRGYMEAKTVSRAAMVNTKSIFEKEYCAIFPKDSDGFFKRTLIEGCVTSDTKLIRDCWFDPMIRGDIHKKYIIGIDPASEADNFSIAIIELNEDHNRLVYCWSTTRKIFKEKERLNLTKDTDFYGYCARKVRELLKSFKTERIGLDAQGGGIAILESLHDTDKLYAGEQPIWEIIEDDRPRDTDDKEGLHLIELVQFARAEWVSEANHGLKKDLEDKFLLFPRFDSLSLSLATAKDEEAIEGGDFSRLYDSYEECVFEIEELKNELSSIVHTKTSLSGRDRWDTPEIKTGQSRKIRSRKDRYSAFLIANMIARQHYRREKEIPYDVIGTASHLDRNSRKDEILYSKGPEWFTKHADGIGRIIKR